MRVSRIPSTFVLLAAFGGAVAAGPKPKKPTLKIVAIPRGGAVPLQIQFLAKLTGGDDRDPELYCLEAVWNFENSLVVDAHDCEPLENGGTIQRSFSTTHTFESEGSYKVSLTLRRRNEAVLTTFVKVLAVVPGLKDD